MNREDEVNKRLAAKDTMNTGKLEQQAALQKKEEEGEVVVDTDDAREVLQRSWLGKMLTEQPVTNDKGEKTGYQQVWVKVSDNAKTNEKGFSSLWGTLLPYLTRAAQMSYLREENIEKLLKATIRDLWSEILANFDEYEISPEHAKQIVGEALVIMIGAINKSRDGRGLVNQEKTTVEKIARRVGISDDDESGVFGGISL